MKWTGREVEEGREWNDPRKEWVGPGMASLCQRRTDVPHPPPSTQEFCMSDDQPTTPSD